MTSLVVLIYMAARVLGQPGCRCNRSHQKKFLAWKVSPKYKDKDLTPSLAISLHM